MFKNFPVLSVLLLALTVGATETPPFYVSKISASGAYSSNQFKLLWDTFRQEYSVTEKGTFKPYYFTKNVLSLTESSRRRGSMDDRFIQLFYDQEKSDNPQHLTGNQDAFKEANKYISFQLAMEGARSRGARLVRVTVGEETGTPGVFKCEVNGATATDVDVLDEPAGQADNLSSTSIVFCDPKNPRIGQASLFVETAGHSYTKSSYKPAGISTLREVGTILDSKPNQDSFLESLKAGSSFRVFWFKESTCTNCGGLGRLSTLAVNQSGGSRINTSKNSGPFGSSGGNAGSTLSLTPGVSTARDKCPACYGSGKRMRGYVTTLLWDDKGPTFDAAR